MIMHGLQKIGLKKKKEERVWCNYVIYLWDNFLKEEEENTWTGKLS